MPVTKEISDALNKILEDGQYRNAAQITGDPYNTNDNCVTIFIDFGDGPKTYVKEHNSSTWEEMPPLKGNL